MLIDFHVHGKLTKKSEFDLIHFLTLLEYARESGLDALALTEHFNTRGFYEMYRAIDENFQYVEDHYLFKDLKIFLGLEVDVVAGGHVLAVAKRENILTLRRQLDPFTEESSFITLRELMNRAEPLGCLMIGAHPYRGEHPLALTQEQAQLKRLHAFDLNATDIFKRGLERTKGEVDALAKRLGRQVVTGSDTHYPVQLGSVRTGFPGDCLSLEEIKACIQQGSLEHFVSDTLKVKVFSAKIVKSYLKRKLELVE